MFWLALRYCLCRTVNSNAVQSSSLQLHIHLGRKQPSVDSLRQCIHSGLVILGYADIKCRSYCLCAIPCRALAALWLRIALGFWPLHLSAVPHIGPYWVGGVCGECGTMVHSTVISEITPCVNWLPSPRGNYSSSWSRNKAQFTQSTCAYA